MTTNNFKNIFFIFKNSIFANKKIIFLMTFILFLVTILILIIPYCVVLTYPNHDERIFIYNSFAFNKTLNNTSFKIEKGVSYYLTYFLYCTPDLVIYGAISFTLIQLLVMSDIRSGRISIVFFLPISRKTIITTKIFTIIFLILTMMVLQFLLTIGVVKVLYNNFGSEEIKRVFLSAINMFVINIFFVLLILAVSFLNFKNLNMIAVTITIFSILFLIFLTTEILLLFNANSKLVNFLTKIDLRGYMAIPAISDFTSENAIAYKIGWIFPFKDFEYLKFSLSVLIFSILDVFLFMFVVYKFNNRDFSI
ncbi:hypothetical protein [Spiroplasma endosymbiont of Aspidapion aeneum]|uniref:hypothetical protein n=1 Tax=Spiroplasma endosymbiont of Aspidapion aeneum TaxID=3066276 RepID=UPI00313D2022